MFPRRKFNTPKQLIEKPASSKRREKVIRSSFTRFFSNAFNKHRDAFIIHEMPLETP